MPVVQTVHTVLRAGTQRGSGAIQLLTAIGLALLLWATAVPRLEPMLAAYDLQNATSTVATDLRLARTRAVTQNTRTRLTFAGQTYVVQREEPRGSDIFVDFGAPQALPRTVRVSFDPDVPVFDGRGFAHGAPFTVTLSGAHGATSTITVSAIGRVNVG